MLIKDPAKQRLLVNIVSLLSLKGVDVLVPLLVAPYLIRVVGLEKFGLIAFSLSFAAYFSALINYGFNITAARDIARCRCDIEKVSWIYSHTIASVAFLSILGFLLAGLALAFFPHLNQELWLFLSAFALVVMQASLPVWLFSGFERMAFIGGLGALSKVAYIILLFVFVREESDYVYVNIIYASSAAVVLSVALILVRVSFGVKFVPVTLSGVVESLRNGFSIFVMQVSPVLYNNSSVFILGLTSSPSVVGVFSAAMRVVEVVTTGGRLIATAFLPYLAIDVSRHGLFAKIMMAIGAVFTVAVFLLSSYISNLLFAADGDLIAVCLKWLSVGVVFGYAYLVYGVNYLSLRSMEGVAARISLIVSVLGFLMLLIFVPYYDLLAAVTVFVLSRFLLATLSFGFYLKGRG